MDNKGMSKSMKSMWIMIVITLSLFVLGFIIHFIVKSGSDAGSPKRINDDLKISSVHIINYEDVNVSLKKNAYNENLIGARIIFYDDEENEILIEDVSIEELEKNKYICSIYVENTSRIKKITMYSLIRSESLETERGSLQDTYKVVFNGTVFSPPKDETGYSREKVINCTHASDCKDDNPCTVGSCTNGICSYPLIPGCEFCKSDLECDDNDSCTKDLCLERKCVHTDLENCTSCNSSFECDDGNVCTTDECIKKACVNKLIEGCKACSVKSDCHDDNPCTEDICSEGKCSSILIPGCVPCSHSRDCRPEYVCVDGICVLNRSESF
jgi:hypothetical protein